MNVPGPFTEWDWSRGWNTSSLQAIGLVHWWPLHPTLGHRLDNRRVPDIIRGNHADANNSPDGFYNANTEIGAFIAFDGVQDHLEPLYSPSFGTHYSVSAWIYPHTATNPHLVFAQKTSSEVAWQLFTNGTSAVMQVGHGSGYATATYSSVISAYQPYHLLGVRAGNTVKIYVNGLKGTDDSRAFSTVSSGTTYIGRQDSGAHFVGGIKDVRYYNRALTDADAWHMWHPQTRWDLWPMQRRRTIGLAIAGALSTARLTWQDNSDSESGFSIERSSTSATAGFSEIDTVAADTTQYDDTDLSAGTYWYRVRAFDAEGNYSDYSEVAEVTVS